MKLISFDYYVLRGYLNTIASKLIGATGQKVSRASVESGAFLLPAPVSLRVSVDAKFVDVGASLPEPTSSGLYMQTILPVQILTITTILAFPSEPLIFE
jgi:hypothetical protein